MKKLFTTLCYLLLVARFAFAQDAPTMFSIYTDDVKPTMNAVYREGVKKLKAACEQHKVDVHWSTTAYDDNSYTHLVPIKAFADLDNNPFAPLEAKIGKDAMAAMWNELDKCVESHRSFVVLRLPGLSYLTPPADENFFDITFWQVESGHEAEAEAVIMEWKKLYESKKAPGGFIAYRSIFGGDPDYAFVAWGKNPVDLATKEQKNNELFGEEAGKLWAKTMLITKRVYTKRGWRQTDLSYSPPAATTATK